MKKLDGWEHWRLWRESQQQQLQQDKIKTTNINMIWYKTKLSEMLQINESKNREKSMTRRKKPNLSNKTKWKHERNEKFGIENCLI